MNEATNPDRRTSGTATIGVGIAVGMVVLVGFGVLAFRMLGLNQARTAFMSGAPAFAKTWAEDLRAGRLDQAYGATTPAFKARLGREAFGRWVADHPELKSETSVRGYTMSGFSSGITIGLNGIRVLDTMPSLTYRTGYRAAGGEPRVLTLVVVSEGDRVVVDQAEIEPEAPSKP